MMSSENRTNREGAMNDCVFDNLSNQIYGFCNSLLNHCDFFLFLNDHALEKDVKSIWWMAVAKLNQICRLSTLACDKTE